MDTDGTVWQIIIVSVNADELIRIPICPKGHAEQRGVGHHQEICARKPEVDAIGAGNVKRMGGH